MTQTFDSPTEAGAAYVRWIAKTGYAEGTGKVYAQRVGRFLAWIEADDGEYGQALSDEFIRDYAVRDFRAMLMREQKASVATVEGYMAAIGQFYEWLGLGRPRVKRSVPKRATPKALGQRELRTVLRIAERRGPRDFAIAMLLFQTAVRVSELADLDTDDVFISDRMGRLEVRHGKGGEARQVHIPADARAAVRAWLVERRNEGHPEVGPLFISRKGNRISVRRLQSLMSMLGLEAGVRLTPHVFRHTFARFYLEEGGDLGGLQLVLGHKHLSSTQVYTGASDEAIAEASDRVRIDL